MEPEKQDPGISLFQLNLDAGNSYTLMSAASWAKVLGVVGTIIGLITIVSFIYMLSRPAPVSGYTYRQEGFNEAFADNPAAARLGYWIFIVIGFVFMIGGIFSFLFGNKINAALRSNDQEGLEKGFGSLRNYFAFRSIMSIILLLLILFVVSSAI